MTAPMSAPCPLDQHRFGPVSHCRGFDFTFRFQNIILALLPCSIFIVLGLLRAHRLLSKTRRAPLDLVRSSECLFAALLPILAIVGLASAPYRQLGFILDRSTLVPALVLQLIAAISLVATQYLESRRTLAGHFLVPSYLTASLLFGAVQVRSLYLARVQHDAPTYVGSTCATLAVYAILLILIEIRFATNKDLPRRLRAPFFNRLVFFWQFNNLLSSVRAPWSLDRLKQLDPTLSSRVYGHRLQKQWEQSVNGKGSKWRLSWALARSCPVLLFKPVIYKLILLAATLSQPFLISDALAFLQPSGTAANGKHFKEPLQDGWGLVGAFALVYTVIAFSSGQYYFSISQCSFSVRGSLMHVVLQHTHDIHLDAASQAGPSAATSLVAADVERVVEILEPLHEAWAGIITIGIASYVLYLRAGLCFLGPLVLAVVFLTGLPLINGTVSPAMANWTEKTDKRVGLTASIFRGIQTIKSCAWDRLAFSMLSEARRVEGKHFRFLQRQLVRTNVFTNVLEQALALSVILPLALIAHFKPSAGYVFDLNTAFTILTAVTLLQQPLFTIGQYFKILFISFSSLQRIQAFLESPARMDARQAKETSTDGPIIRMKDVVLSRGMESAKTILSGVSLAFPAASISVITGPTGSGKSTLLLALMGELAPQMGSIETRGAGSKPPRIAYASQKPWIMESSSLSKNILCGRPLDQEWYDTVLEACAILDDSAFDIDASSMTNLSGGQRQRISLARCMYGIREADLVLIDDSFSALDAVTETRVVQSLVRLQQHFGFALICVTESGHLIDRARYLVELGAGSISYQGPVPATKQRRFKTVQKAKDEDADEIVAASTSMPDPATKGQVNQSPPKSIDDNNDHGGTNDANHTASWATFWFWARAGSPTAVVCMVICFALFVLSKIGAQLYLQSWSSNQLHWQLSIASTIYTLFTLATAIVLIGMLVALFAASSRAAQIIHDGQVKSLLASPLHRFTPEFLATITTRLSQDLFLIDLIWPSDLFNFVLGFLDLVASLLLMIIPAPFLLIPFVSTMGLSVILIILYTPSSRSLRHIDLTAKDPLLAFYTELQDGVDTIRTFDAPPSRSDDAAKEEGGAIEQGLTLIDSAQLPYYYLEASRKWLQTWLNLITALVNTCLIIILVGTRSKLNAGSVLGVSLLQTVSLSESINQVMISWTEAQISSVAIDRARVFTLLEAEKDGAGVVVEGRKIRLRMGREAAIEFKNYSARYYGEDEGEVKLKGVNLRIERGEHVVICGPSGCGKSTLLHALTGTIDSMSGGVWLNGKDASQMSLFDRRSGIVLVPQSGFQLIGRTLRDNLCIGTCLTTPDSEIPDTELHSVLRSTQLHTAVESLKEGLETILETSSFSPGQWALLNLARCILISRRRECIVLLDEINASLDRATDEVLQRVIREELQGVTVLAVMHKLDAQEATGGWGKVVTMAGGRVESVVTNTGLEETALAKSKLGPL